MLALSTDWNAHRHTDGELLLREIQALGFNGVALGAGTKISQLAGMKRMFSRGIMPPVALESDFLSASAAAVRCQHSVFSSSDRTRIVRQIAQTIDYAAELGAPTVLLRLGRGPLTESTTALAAQAANGGLHSRRYVRQKLTALTRRSRAARTLMERLKELLEMLLPAAKAQRVKLALLTQTALEAAPNEGEIQELLLQFGEDCSLTYWHDFATAQVKANLSLLDHAGWLRRVRPRLAGAYVQDVAWPDLSNRLPFRGMIPFRELLPLLPAQTPLVWQIPNTTQSPEIRQALATWDEEFPLIA